MSGPAPLTLESAQRALRQIGCAPATEGGDWLCPRCGAATLTISQNGAGPRLECAGGCDGIGGYLEAVASLKMPKGEHVDKREIVRDKLGLPELEGIRKDGRLGEHYSLRLKGGRIVAIGGVDALISQAKFRAAFLPQLRRLPPRHKPADWDAIVELMEQIAEERDTVASAEEEALTWLAGWLHHASVPVVDIADSAQLWDALAGPTPALRTTDGRLCLRLSELLLWIGRRTTERVTQRELSMRLARLGFTRPDDGGQLAARRGAETRRARYWISPAGFEATR